MGWLEDLRNNVSRAVTQNPVVRAVTQSPPARMAGRALKSSYVRPTIGFKPEIGGIILSEFLPKESPAKALVDAGLYLTSGPLNITLGLGGSTPQSNDPYGRWQQLGYRSREDMIGRIALQQRRDAAGQVANQMPGVFIADDYGPPRPVRYQDGGLMIGDYAVTRFDTQAERELAANQPQRNITPPASTRPVEERRAPVTKEMPASPTTPKSQSTSELAQLYARQRILGSEMARGGELQRRLYEGGAADGMPVEKFMSWVEAHPDLAYRLAEKRGLLPESI